MVSPNNSDTQTRSEVTEEPIRKCQYCGEEVKSRGLFAHVMNSSGDGHGKYRQVPDDFSHSESPIIGYEDITTEHSTVTGPESGKEVVFCKICNQPQKGVRGYHIHVSKQAGKNGHPEDPAEVTPRMFEIVPADDEYNPLYEPDLEMESEPETNHPFEVGENVQEGMFIPLPALVELHDTIMEGGRDDALDELNAIVQRYS